MSKRIKAITLLGGAAVGAALLTAAPTAGADPSTTNNTNDWGQQVKACNAGACVGTTSGYPGGTSRGGFVSPIAQNPTSGAFGSGPGYAGQLHAFGTPGNSAGHTAVP
jgi:hypothetical protein